MNSNDFAKAFDRVVRENSTYYVLGYYPANDRRDGRFRKISVRVNRPGLEVRARRGYAAPKGEPATTPPPKDGSVELREALNSPIPVSGLTLRAFVAPFKGTAPNASLLLSVELDGRDLKFVEGEGLFRDSLELTATAIDQSGKVRDAKPHTLKLDLRPQTHAAVVQNGFRITTRLQVPPGRYQIRIGGRDANGGSVGTVLYDVEVPDYWKAPFAMSGLVVTAASAARTPTANPDTELKDVLPGPPVAIREFPTGDRLVLYTEVYDSETAKPHGVDITTTLTSNEGRVVFTNERGAQVERAGGAAADTATKRKYRLPAYRLDSTCSKSPRGPGWGRFARARSCSRCGNEHRPRTEHHREPPLPANPRDAGVRGMVGDGAPVLGVEPSTHSSASTPAQSVVGLGRHLGAGLACYFAAFLVLSIAAAGFTAMLWTAMAVWTVGLAPGASVCTRHRSARDGSCRSSGRSRNAGLGPGS